MLHKRLVLKKNTTAQQAAANESKTTKTTAALRGIFLRPVLHQQQRYWINVIT